jgi:GTP-binding protein
MAFVDEITIHLKAGRGGDGVVRWRHEKFIDRGGPAGGNGGKGGDVYIEAVRDIGALAQLRHIKELKAEDGEAGGGMRRAGRAGKDLVVLMPVGSFVVNQKTGFEYELQFEGQRIKVLEGGVGGKGNAHFKGPHNTAPRESTDGLEGDEADFYVELRLFADVGLIGLPNAGKSSLLNALTKAQARVGSYPFTTLEPNLGDFYGKILADIPGLIEGAGEGKGLGSKFLKHIRRTKMLVHCISLQNQDVLSAYNVVRKELDLYDQELTKKEEIIVLTKSDLSNKEKISRDKKRLKKATGKDVFVISILDKSSLKNFADNLSKILGN